MTTPSNFSPWIGLSLVLNVATLATVGWLATRTPDDAADASTLPEEFEELSEEIAGARLEMRRSAERLEALVTRISSREDSDADVPSGHALGKRALADLSNDELLERWKYVQQVLSENRFNPLERTPVEEERGKVEGEMRARGDATVATIAAKFRAMEEHWSQTRLLTHVIEPIATDAAYRFAKGVFEDPTHVSGIRLYAAQVAMKQPDLREDVVGQLVDLLEHPDATFSRREDIVNFLKTSPDPRALPVLSQLAKAPETDKNLRGFAVQALGSYHGSETVAALQELAEMVTLGNLRIEALRSLHKIQGKEVLPFARGLREKLGMDDPGLKTFVDNLDQLYQDGN